MFGLNADVEIVNVETPLTPIFSNTKLRTLMLNFWYHRRNSSH